jgi:single-stranded-DNA-specific exonuclease
MGNPAPVFTVCGAKVADRRVMKEKHLKLRLDCHGALLDAIGFNMAEIGNMTGSVDAAFSLDINRWNGRTTVQMRLKDLKDTRTGPVG